VGQGEAEHEHILAFIYIYKKYLARSCEFIFLRKKLPDNRSMTRYWYTVNESFVGCQSGKRWTPTTNAPLNPPYRIAQKLGTKVRKMLGTWSTKL
jgi:hypothetical protein